MAIIGLGMIAGEAQPGRTVRAMEAEVARLAIEDAGLKRSDINGSIQMRRKGGGGERATSTDAFPRVLGLPVNFHYEVGRGGCVAGLAIPQAMAFLELGIADYVVIANAIDDQSRSQASKAKGLVGRAPAMEKTGYWGKPFGDLRAVSHHSFFAARHMHEYGTTSRQFGAISAQQRAWAQMNPKARFYGRPSTVEDHQASPLIVEPYRLLDICVNSDGGVAAVITTEDRAKDSPKPPIWIEGVGFGEAMAKLWWDKENYTKLAVETAKAQAFGYAGITEKDIDTAQLYDCFTGEVLFQLEDYGFCGKGEGGAYVEEGNIGPGGSLAVNTSGGLLSAYHFGDLTGLSEAILQLRGEAGERQLDAPELALVTGHGGEVLSPGMASIHSTLVLGRD